LDAGLYMIFLLAVISYLMSTISLLLKSKQFLFVSSTIIVQSRCSLNHVMIGI